MNAANHSSGGVPGGLFSRLLAMSKGPQLSQLAGMKEARQWGEAVARDVARYREKKIVWKDVDPGCVLYGPPGTGTTTFAKALANTCHLPLITTSYAEWQSAEGGHLGTTMAAMKAAFADAIAKAPCILFIDELDSIPIRGNGGQNANYNTQVTNALLKEFDGLKNVDGVIVVGACNHPEMLDAALVRSGRMDRMIAVTLPSVHELESIVTYHVTQDELRSLCDGDWLDPIPRMALMCSGMSGADVEKLVRNARSVARQADRPLAEADFMDVLDSPSKHPSSATQLRTAVHEAGHALVGLRLDVSTDITASVVQAKGSSGRVNIKPASEPATRASIENLITFLLAGRAAEALAFDHPSELSGGAGKDNDLAQATRLAFDALTKLGFSEHRGLVWQAGAHHEQALPIHGPLAEEIKGMLDACYQRAQDLITTNEEFLKGLDRCTDRAPRSLACRYRGSRQDRPHFRPRRKRSASLADQAADLPARTGQEAPVSWLPGRA